MSARPAPPIPQARILVVDDETAARTTMARALNLMGYRADEAASGSQALAQLAAHPYDLMLLDLRMPDMDGVEVLQRVQESHPNLLVIVFTAHATLESAIAAVRAGAADYLLKPCPIRDVEAALARALQRRRERLRRQHLFRVITDALAALQAEEEPETRPPLGRLERFLQCGPVTLDQEKRLVVVAGADSLGNRDAELTAHETALLAYLMQHPDAALPCRELALGALGYHVSELEAQGLIRPHISHLRKKIEPDPVHPRLIRTVRGKGYLFSPS